MESVCKNSRISKNHKDDKSNGYDKQTDDFQATFPNFMTLTDEERREFFQTLYAAKVNLEKSGVIIKPQFGTIHDKAWNSSDISDNGDQKSIDNDDSISSESNPPKQFKSNTSVCALSREEAFPTEPTVLKKPEKGINKTKVCNGLISREKTEGILGTSDSLENSLAFKKKVFGIKALIDARKNNSMKNLENNPMPSLSYEVLNEYHDGEKMMTHNLKDEQRENVMKAKGKKLKVQVTLTSGDNDRTNKDPHKTDKVVTEDHVADCCEMNTDKNPNTIEFKQDIKAGFEDTKIDKKPFVERGICNREVEQFHKVEEQDRKCLQCDKNLAKEDEKTWTKTKNKRLHVPKQNKRDGRKFREPKAEFGIKCKNLKRVEPPLVKAKNLTDDGFLLGKELQLGNGTVENRKKATLKGNTDPKVIIKKDRTERNAKRRNSDNQQSLGSKSSIIQKGPSASTENRRGTKQRIPTLRPRQKRSPEPKEKTVCTEQNPLRVTALPEASKPKEDPEDTKECILSARTSQEESEPKEDPGDIKPCILTPRTLQEEAEPEENPGDTKQFVLTARTLQEASEPEENLEDTERNTLTLTTSQEASEPEENSGDTERNKLTLTTLQEASEPIEDSGDTKQCELTARTLQEACEPNENRIDAKQCKLTPTTLQEACEPNENPIDAKQTVLTARTLHGAKSHINSERQTTEGTPKDRVKAKLARQLRVEKLERYMREKEGSFYRKLQKKNTFKEQNENSTDLKKEKLNEEEGIKVGASKAPSVSCKVKKEETGKSNMKRTNPCSVSYNSREIGETQNDNEISEAAKISGSHPVEIPEKEKENIVKASKSTELRKCIPPLKTGKVIFVADNVIEKIRNVILDLEKKAKDEECYAENEYLILLVNHVEYLSTVMETFFENQTLKPKTVRFDDQNLIEVQQCLQVSTTTEEDFDSDVESETSEKYNRKNLSKPSIITSLRHFFSCGGKKMRRNGRKR